MLLKEIFSKPVDRSIEGVIKADDLAQLKLEVEEYVFTTEISKRLSAFFSAYNDYQGANGAWISGFFGSGKSHLLKMLALMVENAPVDGKPALGYFLPKCGDDAILQAEMRRAAAIPSKSILFNIDQKADAITLTDTDAVLRVFVKVFDETCGYYGKQGYIAQFERHLDQRGWLDEFKQAFLEIAGKPWEQGREQSILEAANVATAYARVSGATLESSQGILDRYRKDYSLSIEDFAELVNAYIEKQPPGFRLNFFVDEMGQYVADNTRLMTNLQTIAESFATRCKGRAWLVVTAQEDIESVLGEMNQQQANDFTRIQDRFKTRLKLTSANVAEVIQKRLLEKNPTGKALLEELYTRHHNNFGTWFDFSDGSQSYRNDRGSDHFVDSYPFIPYQFDLFHQCIGDLSRHNAFEGRHTSVGERSMLGVFQHVAQSIVDQPIGVLASFDGMFEGIRTTLQTHLQSSIQTAEHNLQNPLAIRLLKALFLVKYVKSFKATPHNLRILLQSRFDEHLLDLGEKVAEALSLLEQQTYIQRNGELYEFLTDEEKDIEQEIKNTSVDTVDLHKVLEDVFFTDIVRDRKIRYEVTGQDFPFTKKLDGRVLNREQELAIHLISPLNENVERVEILQSNSLALPELLVVLPADSRLVSDLYLLKKTENYLRQNSSTALPAMRQLILTQKSMQNNERLNQIKLSLRELVGRARLFAAGSELGVNGEEPRTRILRGFSELVQRIYPNLRMLNSATFSESQVSYYLQLAHNTPLSTLELTEAELELLSFIEANNRSGIRTTFKSLEDKFTRKPYGWDLAAVQCLTAKLCGRDRLEARSSGSLLENDALVRAITNTHLFPNIILEPLIEFTAAQVRRLKDFFSDFFDRPSTASEARLLARETVEALRSLLSDVDRLYQQRARYPFLSLLQPLLEQLTSFLGKPYDYYFTTLLQQQAQLIEVKDSLLDPIRRFMSGANRGIYDEASRFLDQQRANFAALDPGSVQRLGQILADPGCYTGDHMRQAKTLTALLQSELAERLQAERQAARQALQLLQQRTHQLPDFDLLPAEKQAAVDEQFESLLREIDHQVLIPVIRDHQRRFEQEQYHLLLSQITTWAQQSQPALPGAEIPDAVVEYVALQTVLASLDQHILSDEAAVELYVSQLKAQLLQLIRSGRRIHL